MKTCFVIMPFGEKTDVNGKTVDFDKIYTYLIKKAIVAADLGIECVRCDEIDEAGWIHKKMFEHIYDADVAIVDITSLNPNVFYELGVRHTLAKSITILLRSKGTNIPFNVRDFKFIEYDFEDVASVEETREKIVDFIRTGLKDRNKSDSPVYDVLNLKTFTVPKPIVKKQIFEYRLKVPAGLPARQVCLITGDIRNVTEADVWVSSENTNMEMARPFDRSISSVIRYEGAKKDDAGNIVEDAIATELAKVAGPNADVPAGSVLVSGSGELEGTNKVKKIFHAAAARGAPGIGYVPVENLDWCVRNALQRADSPKLAGIDLKSILFPLLGTGTARGDSEEKAPVLIDAAIGYLLGNPQSKIERVYFLCWTEKDLEVCRRFLLNSADVAPAQVSAAQQGQL
jgi:O-acetyl-ADP-ribose deacetylase (regulator of RNase III)